MLRKNQSPASGAGKTRQHLRPSAQFCFPFALLFTLSLCLQPVLAQDTPDPSSIFLPLILKHLKPDDPAGGPAIGPIATNLTDYPNGKIPRYEKLELTFDIDTVAENLQWPYDPVPPPGVEPGTGITVNALFTPDNWQTVYRQPAFYYQEFVDEVRSGQEWFYPTESFAWKVRFAPNQVGTWQYKLTALDATGIAQTTPQAFTVVPSEHPGFIRVSSRDPRYFEFEDGSYFPALGYNMNYDHVSWINPTLDNQEDFQKMSQNGIQLIRIWLSQWGIFTSAWSPWNAQEPDLHSEYIPEPGMTHEEAYPDHETSMELVWDSPWRSACMFIGQWKAKPAVKRNTDYRFRVRYKATGITGPRVPTSPYGFVVKIGAWLWPSDSGYCYNPGVGTVIGATYPDPSGNKRWRSYPDSKEPTWRILEGSLSRQLIGDTDFLPNFFLTLENVDAGKVYIDYVWIEEDLGNGEYGPNIVSKPWMAQHMYFEQRNSYAFDKLLALAERNGIYLRPVVLEKNERILNLIDYNGNFAADATNDWFYGNYRTVTKVRWLQQAWWRYLQARWGYSTHIHSWELLNEGDPANDRHFTLADQFGEYMHGFQPNHHLVSTSFWHSFPQSSFWANPAYPDVDFADYHRYIPESDTVFADAAQATYEVSTLYGALRPGGAGKPIIRGETGFVKEGSWPPVDLLENDTQGIWLHNFIWGGINPGGLIESYWYETTHIYRRNWDGTYQFDHRHHYAAYHNFVEDIPLNNGRYRDAEAAVSNGNLRAWGQKDLVHGCAHLWLQNKKHTWKNVLDGVAIPTISGTVSVAGFQPGARYRIEWWDPYQPDPALQIIRTDNLTSQADGSIVILTNGLATDVAVKIVSAGGCTS